MVYVYLPEYNPPINDLSIKRHLLALISLFRTCVVNRKVTSRIESALVCDIRADTREKTRVQPFFLEIEVEHFFDGSHL